MHAPALTSLLTAFTLSPQLHFLERRAQRRRGAAHPVLRVPARHAEGTHPTLHLTPRTLTLALL